MYAYIYTFIDLQYIEVKASVDSVETIYHVTGPILKFGFVIFHAFMALLERTKRGRVCRPITPLSSFRARKRLNIRWIASCLEFRLKPDRQTTDYHPTTTRLGVNGNKNSRKKGSRQKCNFNWCSAASISTI